MKTKRILIVFSLIAALFLVTSQVLAAPNGSQGPKKTPGAMATLKAEEHAAAQVGNPHGKNENYKGKITLVDASSITIVLTDATPITAVLTPETRIRIPTLKSATAANLLVGMNVVVHAVRGKDDILTARSVGVIPGKPTFTHRVGIVTVYEPATSITIQAKDGLLYTFLLTVDTKILPAERIDLLVVGARVTIIAPRDVSVLLRTATGIVVHPAVTEN
jgi:hypothetical protein